MPIGWLIDWQTAPAPWVTLLAGLALYVVGVTRLRRRGRSWSRRRSATFLAGWGVLLIALCSPLAAHDESFPVHMVQHLLIGMLAPLLFALSAPITLALRVLRPVDRRSLVRILHSRAARALAFPPIGALIYTASLWTLYLTPLFAQTLDHPLLHEALHVHFLLVGCLFMWPLVGLDPVGSRSSMRVRIGVLLLALGSHAALAKLIYAGWMGGGLAHTLPTEDIHAGAQLMYYGGDAIDAALLVIFFAQWYARAGRALAHAERRSTGPSIPGMHPPARRAQARAAR
ncbi:MAG: cytochrome c oxidase assembly protein [Solirubrobacterales bacterium]|nr:cytochrome c oxidase assembly protein [Solirubrobacterales bacterium]